MTKLNLSEIYKIYLQEKESRALVQLPQDFYASASELIRELKEKLAEATKIGDDELITRYNETLKTIKHYLKSIFQLRLKKIVNLALLIYDLDEEIADTGLLPKEKRLLRNIINEIKEYKEVIDDILKGEYSEEVSKFKYVVFRENLPAFIWEDEKTYGPFEKGDIAVLEEKLAEYLVSNKKAEYL